MCLERVAYAYVQIEVVGSKASVPPDYVWVSICNGVCFAELDAKVASDDEEWEIESKSESGTNG